MGAAQESYRAMLRDQVAPRLRALGMKGSGGSFTLPDPSHHLLVGFQASVSSTGERVRFTVNLAVMDKVAWEARKQGWWGRPSANSQAPIGVYERLCSLLPKHQQDWWTVSPGDVTGPSAADLCADVERYGVPWMLDSRSRPETSTPWTELDGRARRSSG